jgi:hypothetical protein
MAFTVLDRYILYGEHKATPASVQGVGFDFLFVMDFASPQRFEVWS